MRHYSRKFGQRDRPRPFHKEKRRVKMISAQNPGPYLRKNKAFTDSNDPRLIKRFHKWAHKATEASGFAARLSEFEKQAAAFPNPPELLFSTMLERSPIVTPDLQPWEAAMKDIKEAKADAMAPEWPKELTSMAKQLFEELEAAERQRKAAALQAGASGGAESGGPGAAGLAGPRSAKERRLAAQAAEAEARFGADDVERRAAALRGEGGGVSQFATQSTRLQSRLTKNDELGNTRSLDRAYADRLLLLVRRRDSGEWDLPGAPFRPAEELSEAAMASGQLIAAGGAAALGSAVAHLSAAGATLSQQQLLAQLLQLPAMPSAAWRSLLAALGDDVRPWYVGTGPVAVHLEPFSPEVQADRGCFGRKRFLFRADILDGRIELPEGGEYDDYQWLTRLEAQQAAIVGGDASHAFKPLLLSAMGWAEQEFVHRAGIKPTPSGRPEAVAEVEEHAG